MPEQLKPFPAMKPNDKPHPHVREATRNSFCLASLQADGDQLRLRWLGSGLNRGDAKARAERANVGSNAIFLTGSAFSTSVGIHFPPSRIQAADPVAIRMAQRHLGGWIEWLRQAAVLRFGLLSRGTPEQFIPAKYLHDRRVRVVLGIPGMPVLTRFHALPSSFDPRDLVDTAHPYSILGLAKAVLDATSLEYWLSDVESQDLPSLCVPLLSVTTPIEAEAAGLRLGVSFLQAGEQSPFSLGRFTHLTIDTAGRISHQDYPADWIGINWAPPSANLAAYLPDHVYRSVDDLAIGSLFADSPRALEAILGRVRTPVAILGKRLHGKLLNECSRVSALIAKNAFPFDLSASTTRVSHFLFGDGDPVHQGRRRNVVDSFPFVINELSSGRMPTLAGAIDDGLPLFRAIGEACDAPQWAVRRARDALDGISRFEGAATTNLAVIVRLLTWLGPDASCPNADTLRTLVGELNAYPLFSPLANEPTWQLQVLARSVGRDARLRGWEDTLDTVHRFAETNDLDAYMSYWDVIFHNIAEVLVRRKIVPKPSDGLITAIIVEWLGQLTLPQMSVHCYRWSALLWGGPGHQRVPQTPSEASLSVVAPFAEHTLIDSRVVISPLLSKERLETEGKDMEHCVGSYWQGIRTYQILVVSLRSGAGRRATLSAHMDADGKWKISELHGPENANIRAGSLLRKGADELLASLNHGPPGTDQSTIEKHREGALTRMHILKHLQGDAPTLHGLPDQLRTMVEPCLPGIGPIDARIIKAHSKVAASVLDGNLSR